MSNWAGVLKRVREGRRSWLVGVLAVAIVVEPADAQSVLVAAGRRGAVAADHPLASEAGVSVMRAGGNALDAAIAAAFMLGVVSPSGSGIGGGGFLIYWCARDGASYALDFREVAPAQLTAKAFVRNGEVDTRLSQVGGLAVGVPGEVAGLREASRRFGRTRWRKLLASSAAVARRGFRASAHTAADIREHVRDLAEEPALSRLYLPEGKALTEGSYFRNPELASTLEMVAADGGESFYRGAIGAAIVRSIRAAGGVLDEADLADYRPIWREPVRGSYRGVELHSMPPPSSGGTILLQVLNVLSRLPVDWKRPNGASTVHYLAEALKHAFSDRARWFGDPAFVKVPVGALTSSAYARRIAARIRPTRVSRSSAYLHQPPSDAGTTHISAMDAEGNAVALTSTINTAFGSMVVADGTGVLLNNEMDDFSIGTGVANAFGLVGSEANQPWPGKRPLSSMSPTIVTEQGRPIIAVGGSGGPRIITGTLRVLTGILDSRLDVGQAIGQPRVHHQWSPDVLRLESGIPAQVASELRGFGHVLAFEANGSAVQAVVSNGQGFRAASDPSKWGRAAAW